MMNDYDDMKGDADVLLLLKLLKKVIYNFEDKKNVIDTLGIFRVQTLRTRTIYPRISVLL
jgi:hypothetical protein